MNFWRKKAFHYFFVSICISVACSEDNDKIEKISKSLDAIGLDIRENDFVLIIPNEGCGLCISNTTSIIVKNIDSLKYDVSVIFTNIRDIKLFKLRVPAGFLSRKNVYIDKENLFNSYYFSSIYPQLIHIDQEKVKRIEVFNENVIFK